MKIASPRHFRPIPKQWKPGQTWFPLFDAPFPARARGRVKRATGRVWFSRPRTVALLHSAAVTARQRPQANFLYATIIPQYRGSWLVVRAQSDHYPRHLLQYVTGREMKRDSGQSPSSWRAGTRESVKFDILSQQRCHKNKKIKLW